MRYACTLILTVYLSRWIDFNTEDLSYDSIPLGPFESPPLKFSVIVISEMITVAIEIICSAITPVQCNWNYLWYHCDIVISLKIIWDYLSHGWHCPLKLPVSTHCVTLWHCVTLKVFVSARCVYTLCLHIGKYLSTTECGDCKICAGQKLSVQVQLKISATICDYGTVQSPRKYLSQCWHCSLEIICDKPYGEHFLVTLSPFRNVIISSSSESSTMDWDADEWDNPRQISIEWCWWCDHTLSIENVWKLQANDKQCSKQFSK